MAGRKGVSRPDSLDLALQSHFLVTHFNDVNINDGDGVDETAVPGFLPVGTITRAAAVGAPLVATTAGNTDNDPAGIHRSLNTLQFRDDTGFLIRVDARFLEDTTEGITNGFIGVTNQSTDDNILADNGGGISNSSSAACFYFVDGSPLLRCHVSRGTGFTFDVPLDAANRNNRALTEILASHDAFRIFEIESKPYRAGECEVTFKVGDRQHGLQLVAQTLVPTAGAALMAGDVRVKCGSNSQAQAITVRSYAEAQSY